MPNSIRNGVCLLIPTRALGHRAMKDVCIEWTAAMMQLAYPVGMNHYISISKRQTEEMTRDQQRQQLAEQSLEVGAEFSMWIDDDTIPPATAIQELVFVMRQNPNAGIVGGIYCTKATPPEPIVFKELGAGVYWDWTLGDVFKCAGLGTGCMLVRNSILKDIPKPWFKDTSEAILGETETYGDTTIKIASRGGTDDLYFCQKVTDAGYDIIAHGGILPVHVDYETGVGYKIPENSYPVTSYAEKLAKLNATLPPEKQRMMLPPGNGKV